MSKETQNKFIKYVDDAETQLSSDFKITNKSTDIDGFVTRIIYSFGEGLVEFLCGPPEYHIEIFVSVKNTDGNLERYDLIRLVSIPNLRSWMVYNKPDMSHGDKIKSEMEWYISLLRELKNLSEFKCLLFT